MNTFDLPSNSNYGDQPIPITFPENWDVHISKIHGYDTPALTEAQIAEKIHAAIGAKLGNPEKTVIHITGDGSFRMNCNELSTEEFY